MAVLKGKIDLVNMSDITAVAGVGIKSTEVLYAVSSNKEIPPDLSDVSLTTTEGDILDFGQDATFQIKNNVLWAFQEGIERELTLNGSYLIGATGWTSEFPSVEAGQYLWTKMIFSYTDGTQTVTYNVSYQGANGAPGPEGPPGALYKIQTNQSEILKFIDSNGQISFSPKNLIITILKEEPLTENGYSQVVDLNLNNLTLSVRNIDTNEWILITEPIISLDKNFNFSVDLQKVLSYGNEAIYPAANTMLNDECILRIDYIQFWKDETTLELKQTTLNEYINIRYAMNKDMATLNLTAGGIVAAVQNSKMNFDANGLTIQNGGFKILDYNNSEVFYTDLNGNLSLKGNIYADGGYFKGDITGASGTFSGRLEAEEGYFKGELIGAIGSFSGDISAASGNIGGFMIGATQLTSKAVDENGIPYITLNGEEGIIFAEKIVLGIGAEIKDYIQIGEQVKLQKVLKPSDSFISVKDNTSTEVLSLKADGSIIVGNNSDIIIIDGKDGSITSSNFTNGQGWKICNTNSIFNDVTVRGSIKASVLEYGQVQAVGGILLIRPSSRIVKINPDNNSIIYLESVQGFEKNDWCLINTETSKNYYKIVLVNTKENSIEIDGVANESWLSYPIVDLGVSGSIGIGINGSKDNSFITPQSVSVFEFDDVSKRIYPKIVLGKLPEETQYGFAGGSYGLYAENVLLRGSLVTQTNDGYSKPTYSGISTLYKGDQSPNSKAYSYWFGENTGSILLWAGANGTSKEEIENSKFFVDEYGNLFAGSGYFKGTIITDAKITASEIETAILTGTGEGPALTIKDARLGIVFQSNEQDLFRLTDQEINANISSVIFNNNFKVNSTGNLLVPNIFIADSQKSQESLILNQNKISYSSNFNESELGGVISSVIDFSDGLAFSLGEDEKFLEINQQQIQANKTFYVKENVKYNEIAEYKPVYKDSKIIGYDLYIE